MLAHGSLVLVASTTVSYFNVKCVLASSYKRLKSMSRTVSDSAQDNSQDVSAAQKLFCELFPTVSQS